MGKFVRQLNQRLQLTDKRNYRREQYQSFMTGPEWRNVEMAEEFADFLQDNKSMFQFPYFRQVFDLWKVLYHSYSAARKYNGFFEIAFSEYMLMDFFVVIFTTLELLPKGIISFLLSPLLKKVNNTEMQQHLAEYFKKYAEKLQTIPFYDHDYNHILADLSKKYKECEQRTWGDWFSWTIISSELWMRQWLCKPLKYWFHQEGNQAPSTTDILIKFDAENQITPEAAKTLFKEQLNSFSNNSNLQWIAEDIYTKEYPKTKNGHTYTSVYARLTVPRYAAFQPVVRELGEKGIHVRKLAGQDRVQVKCTINSETIEHVKMVQKELNETEEITPLYSYGNRISQQKAICLFDVPAKNLAVTLKRLDKIENTTVNFIHNF